MSCRKRPISPTSASHHQPSKRSRLLSALWQPQSDTQTSTTSQQSEYSIRAIIGERPGEYLIDWADNPVTHQSFSPDWQPKRNVSREAIAAWDNRRVVKVSIKKLCKRRRRSPNNPSVTINSSSAQTFKKQKSRRPKSTTKNRTKVQASQRLSDHPFARPAPPEVTVLVSQHSSLDRDQYILYQSSLSISAASSLPQHPDSGIGESSPEPEDNIHSHQSQPKVIPDSQPTCTTSVHASAASTEPQSVSPLRELTQAVPYSVEPAKRSTTFTSRLLQSARTDQEGNFLATIGLVPDSNPSTTVSPVVALDHDLVSGASASDHRRLSLQRLSVQGAGPLWLAPSQEQPSAASGLVHQSRSTGSPEFVISEDQEDERSTTQDTSGSTALSQRDLNSPSRVGLSAGAHPDLDLEDSKRFSSASRGRESDHILTKTQVETSEAGPSMNTKNHPSRIASQSAATRSKPSFSEGLAEIRAKSRAREASFTLENDPEADRSMWARRWHDEATTTIPRANHDQAETPRPASETLSAKNLGKERSKNSHPANGGATTKSNGLPSEQQPVPPQLLSTPQPQVYTTPEQQTRFLVRPMSVPVGVPLAVRPPPASQHLPSAIYSAAQRQGPAHVPKATILKPIGCDPNEHIISLAMNTRVRDQYTSTINMYRDEIMKLMDSDGRDQECINEITKLLGRINLTLQHSDLDAQETLEETSQPSAEDEATWAEQCSFKFLFLRHFLEEIRHQDMHASIVAQPGRLLDLLETFLKGRGIIYFRPDANVASHPGDPRFAHCRCQVSIVPSGLEWMKLAVSPASLVIAFDGSSQLNEPQVHRMREQEGQDWLRPVVRLMVYKSAEHLAKCIPLEIDEFDRTRKIVAGMTQLRHEVGVLQPEDMDVRAAAEEVAIALRLSGHPQRWTLPSIKPLTIDFLESSRSSSTQDGSQLSQDQQVPFESSTLKRAWDHSISTDSSEAKRLRWSQDISHVSDSSIQMQRIESLLNDQANLVSENENLKFKLKRLTTSHKAIEAQLATNARANKQLFSQSLSTHTTPQTLLSELEASLSSLQTRYEDKDRAHKDLHLSLSDLSTTLETATRKLDAQTTDLAALKAAKTHLESDLAQARKDLLATSHPDLSRIARAESAARDALAEVALLKKKTANLGSDFDFTRSEYQAASSAAVELSAQVTSLTAELETATRKASGEAARLAQINKDNAIKEARKEVRHWKAQLEEREKVCRRLGEEIVELKGRRGRGGLGTRGGSVQPGVGVGVAGQGKSPRGSRGGSPLPGVGVGSVGGEGMRRGGSGLRGELV